MEYYLGLDIGGTKCAVILGKQTENGMEFAGRKEIATFAQKTPAETIEKLMALGDELLQKENVSKPIATGVSCGSPLDAEKGLILSPPNLYGWDNIPICEILRAHYGVPSFLENDANACALAEWQFGAGKGYKSVVFLTFGTGMGAGLILDGRLYRGASGGAGEVGHVRLAENGPVGYGKAGSFEGFCSGGGIAQLASTIVLEKIQQNDAPAFCRTKEELGSLTAKSVAIAAQNGDPTALEIYRRCGQYLGRGLAMIMDVINPEVIVLGSIYERSEQLLRDAAMQQIEKEALGYTRAACKVVPAKLGNAIGDYAALAVSKQGLRP